MAYYLALETYQGPLDLLVGLVRRRELDALHVPVGLALGQYLEHLYSQEEFDLDMAGELLLLGSELLALKTRLLLNQPLPEDEAALAEEDKLEMARRLEDYRLFLQAAGQLQDVFAARLPTFGAPRDATAVQLALASVDPLEGVALPDLAAAFLAAQLRGLKPAPLPLSIPIPSISVAAQAKKVLRALAGRGDGLPFSDFFKGGSTRLEVAATLAALLELVRRRKLSLQQDEPFSEIHVRKRKG